MKKEIFDYLDYQLFLQDQIDSMPNRGRGVRAKLATELRCQRSFITQILSKQLHLSLEQAERVCRFLGLEREEKDYFILLVQHGRAATRELREYFRAKITQALENRLIYDKRLKCEARLSFEHQVRYYSNWYYSTIHVALGVPALRTPEALSRKLGLPLELVRDALAFLEKCQLVRKEKGHYVTGPRRLHLGENSILLPRFHAEWRARTMIALQQEKPRDVHFSSTLTLSQRDLHKVQALLVRYIEELQKTVISSADETVAALCIDFFEF